MTHRRSPGEGTVLRRRDGRWQASLQVGNVRRTVYGKTEQEVRRKLAALRRQAEGANGLPDPGRRTVNDLLDEWLQAAAPTLRPKTLHDYRGICDRHIRPALGQTRLSRLSPVLIQRLCSDLLAQEKKRTARLVYTLLHRACALGVLWRWLPENPCNRILPPQHRAARKDVWTPDELRTFLRGALNHRLYPLWLLLIGTGCRLGEALGLAWSGLDLERGTATIRDTLQRVAGKWVMGAPKTVAGERVLTLPPEIVGALKRQRAAQNERRLRVGPEWANTADLVFTTEKGSPLHQAVVQRALRRTCQRLGVRPMSPHSLRHLHASLLLDQGLPLTAVSARLGHSTPAITAGVYAHAIRRKDDGAAGVISEVMGER